MQAYATERDKSGHLKDALHDLQIMIAEPRSRRRGLGREALELFMAFAVHTLVIGPQGCQTGVSFTGNPRLHKQMSCRYLYVS